MVSSCTRLAEPGTARVLVIHRPWRCRVDSETQVPTITGGARAPGEEVTARVRPPGRRRQTRKRARPSSALAATARTPPTAGTCLAIGSRRAGADRCAVGWDVAAPARWTSAPAG